VALRFVGCDNLTKPEDRLVRCEATREKLRLVLNARGLLCRDRIEDMARASWGQHETLAAFLKRIRADRSVTAAAQAEYGAFSAERLLFTRRLCAVQNERGRLMDALGVVVPEKDGGGRTLPKPTLTGADLAQVDPDRDFSGDPALPDLIDPTQDFTTFTEVDAGGYLSETASTITVTSLPRGVNVYLYKDYTANHFGDMDVDVQWNMSVATSNNHCGLFAIGDTPGEQVALAASNDAFGIRLYQDDLIIQAYDNSDAQDAFVAYSTSQEYYATLTRVTAAGVCVVYDDAPRTSVVDTIGCTTTSAKRRYAISAYSATTANSGVTTGTISNLDLNEGAGGATPWLYLPHNAQIIGAFQ
jgi:hypothetical protein